MKNESQIIDFCLLIKTFFPQEIQAILVNKKHQFLISQLEPNLQNLVNLLIHHLTKLYQNQRIIRNNKVIEIAEEDVLTALKIIENLKINQVKDEPKLNKTERNYYTKIHQNFKEKLFTSKEIQTFLNLSKTQTNKILNLFLEQNLLHRYGFENKGFYYKIIQINNQFLEKEEEKTTDIFDGFDDFEDNQNIEYQYRKENFRF